MIHRPIQVKNLSLSFPHKICFENFNARIHYGDRIAIIGRNGSGKSTLLKIMQDEFEPTEGEVEISNDVTAGYVPQIINSVDACSGGQRLNQAITQALSVDPNLLLLDEPTNHLDHRNRKSLMRMLNSYSGTLIIVSHDTELLRSCINTLWHIDQGQIHLFSGNYDDYLREISIKRSSLELELSRLDRQKKDMHQALMKEQGRAAKSNARGEKSIDQRKWPTIVSKSKALRAGETSGRKKAAISHKKQDLSEQLSNLRLPEIIIPQFSLTAANRGTQTLVSISEGTVGYRDHPVLLRNINVQVRAGDKLAIEGDNGSGKSTLVRAILGDPKIITSGDWSLPNREHIGYLDQHYETLDPNQTVLETLTQAMPTWTHAEIRCHLNDFLFRKNEEVNTLVNQLSGGEKARLSLSQIAAKTPKLLVLDEVTNNLDLETRQHVIEVLKAYPGALLVISHDQHFLEAIEVKDRYIAK